MTDVTAETILAAHIAERSEAASYAWSDDTLTRPDRETDLPYGSAGEVLLRVTYACEPSGMLPDPEADFVLPQGDGQNPDSLIRDARDISTHYGVFGVAIYYVGSDRPLAIYSNGEPFITGEL